MPLERFVAGENKMPTAQHHLQSVGEYISQVMTTPTAATSTVLVALSTPWWWGMAKALADGAALALPVIGCVVGLLQAALFARKLWKGKD
jgi:hypothetical protein